MGGSVGASRSASRRQRLAKAAGAELVYHDSTWRLIGAPLRRAGPLLLRCVQLVLRRLCRTGDHRKATVDVRPFDGRTPSEQRGRGRIVLCRSAAPASRPENLPLNSKASSADVSLGGGDRVIAPR